MPETPNHGYNVPSEGTQNWHEPLNENFEQYDTDIEIRDQGSNRDDYEPKAGAKFFDTESGTVYVGNGSTWTRVRPTGPIPTFEQAFIDSDVPLMDFRQSGENVLRLMGEKSGDAARLTLSLYDADGSSSTVFSANRQNHIGIGGLPSVPMDVTGRNNWDLDNNDGDVRIGNNDYRLTMGVALGGAGAGACNIRAKGGIKRLNLGAGTSGHTVQIDPDAVSVNGDLDVSGNKNFVQTVDTADGEREVAYTASESPTPRTEVSGVAELADGRAEVDLPEHFGWVTSGDTALVVETTPYSVDSNGLAVVERSPERVVFEDLEGEGDYEFSYTVRGTREGYTDKEVVRKPSPEANENASTTPADD